MVLNNFGESQKYSIQFSRGEKGDPSTGFKISNDGYFDMSFKRMCNVRDPDET